MRAVAEDSLTFPGDLKIETERLAYEEPPDYVSPRTPGTETVADLVLTSLPDPARIKPTPKKSALPSTNAAPAQKNIAASKSPLKVRNFANYQALLLYAVKKGLRSFILGLSLRSGFLLLLKLMKVFRNKYSLVEAVTSALFKEDSLKYGASLGGFSFLWYLIRYALKMKYELSERLSSGVAGSVASLSLVFLPRGTRAAFSIQTMLRALQMTYNYNKSKGRISFPHGDSLLFALSCMPIMYHFAMDYQSLPKSYYNFMLRMCDVHHEALMENRRIIESDGYVGNAFDTLPALTYLLGGSVDAMHKCQDYVMSNEGRIIVPCSVIHPKFDSCTFNSLRLVVDVFRKIFPVNLALNVVPSVLLKMKDFLKNPSSVVVKSLYHASRSSAFLGVYVAVYQVVICIHRLLSLPSVTPIWLHDILATKPAHNFVYTFGGFICAIVSIYVEDKKRRGELALYAFEKGVESVYHKKLPSSVHTVVSMIAFGMMMSLYPEHDEFMSPMVRGMMGRLVGK
ncbi:hypothetical protein MP638_005756 [Amoeboaphelidium occidentale]|nr:hypothetical protein MP638_005756 [Amoeboaphelidium occidentale]